MYQERGTYTIINVGHNAWEHRGPTLQLYDENFHQPGPSTLEMTEMHLGHVAAESAAGIRLPSPFLYETTAIDTQQAVYACALCVKTHY